VYDVAATAHGDTCTCPDQTYRHEGRDDIGCKHVQALRLMGLLDTAPAPAQTATAELVHQPVALPDVRPDEAPELAPGDDFDPAELDDPDDTREFDPILDEPTPEEWADFEALRNEAAARDFLDTGDRFTLAELVDRQTDHYRGWDNAAGDMQAKHMEELALRTRWVKAETPEDYDARYEIVEQEARETWWKQGYQEGRAAGRREAMPYNGPLD
jgi:hypothetical protein